MKERHTNPSGGQSRASGEWSEAQARRWVQTAYPKVEPGAAALARVEQRVLHGLGDTVYFAGRQRTRRLIRTIMLVYCGVLALSMLGGLVLRAQLERRSEALEVQYNQQKSPSNPIRELNTRVGPVQTLAFSADGSKLIVGGRNHVEIWNGLRNRVPACTWQTDRGTVQATVFGSEDRALLALVRDHSIAVTSVFSGVVDASFQILSAPVVAVAFSPDGKLLAAAGKDSRILMWDIASKRLLCSLRAPGEVHILSFVPDASLCLAAAGSQIAVWTFGGSYAAPVTTYFKDHGPFTALAFTSSSVRVAASVADGTVFIGNRMTGEWSNSIQTSVSPVTALTLSPDGSHMAVGHNNTVVYDIAAGSQEFGFGSDSMVERLAYSPGGQFLAVGTASGKVRICDLYRIGGEALHD